MSIKARFSHFIHFSFWALVLMMMPLAEAWAADLTGVTTVTDNIITSVNELPGFITALSYLGGILMGTWGVLKLKDHVENPNNTPLSHALIRFLAGGALLALPIIYEAAQNAIGQFTDAGFNGGAATFGVDKLESAGTVVDTVFGAIVGALTLGNNINAVFDNITDSLGGVPGFITAGSYLFALVLGVIGILKIKEHVENPNNVPMREGVTALLAAGALFALPTILTAMRNTITGGSGANFDALSLANNFFGEITGAISIATSVLDMGQGFSAVLGYITGSVSGLPVFVSALAYVLGLIFAISGVLRLRDHVNNPNNTPLRNGVIALLVGGMLFTLPTVYSVIYNTISGGTGLVSSLMGTIYNNGGMIIGITDSCAGSVLNNAAGAVDEVAGWFGEDTGLSSASQLNQLLCNITLGTIGLPSFLIFVSYLIGVVLGFWAILKLKEHVENPNQTPIWDAIARFVAAGAFFALPMMLVVFANTVAFGVQSYDTTNFNGEASTGGLDTMMASFMGNIYDPARVLFQWFAYIAGVIFIMVGISRLLKSAQEGARGPGGVGTIMTLLTGGALLSVNPMIGTFSATLFGSSNVAVHAVLSYTSGLGTEEVKHVHAVISAIIQFMIIVGTISFIRGIFIFRDVAEGSGNASMMAGVTHLIGGAIAINLGPFLMLVQNTLGITSYGLDFSGGGG